MNQNPLYDNPNEMKLHTEAIHTIHLHYQNVPKKKVTRLYEIVLRRYKSEAKVKDFLVVLAIRRVREILTKRTGQFSNHGNPGASNPPALNEGDRRMQPS